MPEGYTRSRSRIDGDDGSGGHGGFTPRPSGGGNTLLIALIVVLVIGVVAGAIFLISGLPGGGNAAPTSTPSAASTWEPTPEPTPEETPTEEPTPTPTPTEEPTPTPPATEDITLSFVGNVLASADMLKDAKDKTSGNYDFTPFLSEVKPYLTPTTTDLTIGTLGGALAGEDSKTKTAYSGGPTKYNAPDSLAAALADGGFKVLNLAQWHIFDYKMAGAKRTIQTVDAQGIKHTGVYQDQTDYDTYLYVTAKDVTVAILSYTETTNLANAEDLSAADKKFAYKSFSTTKAKKDIEAVRKNAQIVIVMINWGKKTATAPTTQQQTDAKNLLTYGADAVICTGSDYVQKIESKSVTRADKSQVTGIIAYSLGNFMSGSTTAKKDTGLILNLTFVKDNAANTVAYNRATYVPIWNYFDKDKHFKVLPSGKYNASQDLLSALTATAQKRLPAACKEITDLIGTDVASPIEQ